MIKNKIHSYNFIYGQMSHQRCRCTLTLMDGGNRATVVMLAPDDDMSQKDPRNIKSMSCGAKCLARLSLQMLK